MSWMRKPLPGSIEEAALKIERLMELEEERHRSAPREIPSPAQRRSTRSAVIVPSQIAPIGSLMGMLSQPELGIIDRPAEAVATLAPLPEPPAEARVSQFADCCSRCPASGQSIRSPCS
jgi:hypothetical protein